ncbi:MAG: Cys-tRNA(Pro) deacylase [Acutalibacteraceae bacterium]|nr:Cys-tRNA(Pro) deacylase [Acutalibacteraceae bacterium]
MAKDKNIKTNAMRILDKKKIPYTVNYYQCYEFIDGVHIADKLSQSYDMSFKTLVAVGKSKEYYVFCLPVHKELDLKKAARSVSEKSVELLHVKDIRDVTGYIRGGCTPIGMKKQFKTVIHSSALSFDKIIISGGMLGAQLILSPQSLADCINAKFDEIVF